MKKLRLVVAIVLAIMLLTGCNYYSYLRVTQSGQPIGWGCATVHYRIDVSGIPSLAWGARHTRCVYGCISCHRHTGALRWPVAGWLRSYTWLANQTR